METYYVSNVYVMVCIYVSKQHSHIEICLPQWKPLQCMHKNVELKTQFLNPLFDVINDCEYFAALGTTNHSLAFSAAYNMTRNTYPDHNEGINKLFELRRDLLH